MNNIISNGEPNNCNTNNIISNGEPLKKKRGRRKKSEMEQQPLPNISINIEENLTQNNLA